MMIGGESSSPITCSQPADDLGDSQSLNRRRIVVQRLDFDLEAGVGRRENLVSGCLIALDPLLPASGRNPETVNEDDGVRRAVCHPCLFSVFLGCHDSSYRPLNVSRRPYTPPIASASAQVHTKADATAHQGSPEVSDGVSGGADRSRDQGRPCDHESEREHPPTDLQRPCADRVTEDQDAPDDRGEVGRNRGDSDHLDARAQLKSAGRGIEGTYRGDQGRPAPRADQLERPAFNGVCRGTRARCRNAEERPGGSAEEQTLRRARDAVVGRDRGDRSARRRGRRTGSRSTRPGRSPADRRRPAPRSARLPRAPPP